jgi:hypothetical protein
MSVPRTISRTAALLQLGGGGVARHHEDRRVARQQRVGEGAHDDDVLPLLQLGKFVERMPVIDERERGQQRGDAHADAQLQSAAHDDHDALRVRYDARSAAHDARLRRRLVTPRGAGHRAFHECTCRARHGS